LKRLSLDTSADELFSVILAPLKLAVRINGKDSAERAIIENEKGTADLRPKAQRYFLPRAGTGRFDRGDRQQQYLLTQ